MSRFSHPFGLLTRVCGSSDTNCKQATHAPANAVLDSKKPCHSDKLSAECSQVCVYVGYTEKNT